MSSQFIRVETFGRQARKRAEKWRTIEGILAEAARLPDATPHVERPLAPSIAFGCDPMKLVGPALELASKACDPRRRKLRKDGAVLLAGVASYPMRVAQLVADPEATEQFRVWGRDVRQWIRDRFGSALKSVVVHVDEGYPHLHFFALPDLTEECRLDWSIHPGLLAKRIAAEAGADKKSQEAAYRAAMKKFQDDFWKAVSVKYGHDRTGPKRRRLPRHIHLENERLKRALDAALSELAELKSVPAVRN